MNNKAKFCVVLASDLKYVPYTAVAIQSLIDNCNPQNNYSVFILHSGIDEWNILALRDMGTQNISVDFIDISGYAANLAKYTGHVTQWPKEMMYRLYIPLMPELSAYNKVLYVDGDVIFLTDPESIFNRDIKCSLVAAAKDQDFPFFRNERKDFIRSVLKMKPEDYFNSGVLLFNCTQMRKEDFFTSVISFLEKNGKLPFPDQDTLNSLTSGKVSFLEPVFNAQMHVINRAAKNDVETAIQAIWKKEVYANAAIVHYSAQDKPWTHVRGKPEDVHFWKYARKTPFYEYILADSAHYPQFADYLIAKGKYMGYSLLSLLTTGGWCQECKKRADTLRKKYRIIRKKRKGN
ncbi:MAG: glycosyltransferase family 8 protein [Elusimicrobiota bacterium]|jgi:lipopolysaccharide biosynthesis glycosyltransferase|nr:glycosyltransferase family 8 protein [Elusimicrobiota bacterium]